jgi:hypothetical protein
MHLALAATLIEVPNPHQPLIRAVAPENRYGITARIQAPKHLKQSVLSEYVYVNQASFRIPIVDNYGKGFFLPAVCSLSGDSPP